MPRFKLVDGERVPLTPAEETARDAEEIAAAEPPTPAELDAELDQIADGLLTNNRATKALAVFVFDVWKILNDLDPVKFPNMTPAQFRQQIKNRM